MQAIQPRWSTPAFLVYSGGLAILVALVGLLAYAGSTTGKAGLAGYALLMAAAVLSVALAARRRGLRLTGGVLAFVAVVLFAVFAGALWVWFGWLGLDDVHRSPLHGFHVGRLSFELAWLVAAIVALRAFRHPLLLLQVVPLTWVFATDVLSGGGAWTAVVTAFVGVAFLLVALSFDSGERRPYGFWLHVAAGLTIGGAVIHLLGHVDFQWAIVALASIGYVYLAVTFRRSSWAVLGAIGIVAAGEHYARSLSNLSIRPFGLGIDYPLRRPWAPAVVFAVVGVLLVVLGLAAARRLRQAGAQVDYDLA